MAMEVLRKLRSIVVGFVVLCAIIINVMACASTTKREAVYIPTKCKTKPIPKPYPHRESSVSEEVAEILKYTELLERDLEFCKGE